MASSLDFPEKFPSHLSSTINLCDSSSLNYPPEMHNPLYCQEMTEGLAPVQETANQCSMDPSDMNKISTQNNLPSLAQAQPSNFGLQYTADSNEVIAYNLSTAYYLSTHSNDVLPWVNNSYATSSTSNEIESLGYSRLMPISPANIFECDSTLTSCIPIEQEVGPCIARGGNT